MEKGEKYEWDDEWCVEDILTDDFISNSEEHLMSSYFNEDDCSITVDPYEEHGDISDIPSTSHSKEQSPGPSKVPSPKSSQTVKQNQINERSVEDQGAPTMKEPMSCSECGKCFRKASNLARHKRIHTGEKPFSCSYCGKSFNQKSYLVVHEQIHTGEKPFSCSYCGKSFNQKSYLVIHEKIHKGGKSISCSECGKRFTNTAELARHERIHTGERPFSCSECGKRFKQNAHLVAHQRIHTGENRPSY